MSATVLQTLAGPAIVGIVAYQTVVVLIVLSNAVLLARPGRSGRRPDRAGAADPSVSLLVPARNEAMTIEACVRSMLAQRYRDLEILVLDDRSEDGTGDLLEAARTRDGRLGVLAGEEPPVGWTGKTWACHQLALAARGEVLLFLDADTVLVDPEAVRRIVELARERRADLLSGLPRQVLGTPGEALLVPLAYWALISFTPLVVSMLWRRAPFAGAVGQLMAFRRDAYEAIGGHAAVRGAVAEDIALARRMARAGRPWRLADATSIAACRMYRSGREAADGFAKNLFAAFGYAVVPYAFVWGWLAYVALEPIAVAALHLARPASVPVQPALLVATLALSLVHWVVAYRRLRLPLWPALLYPITMTLFLLLALRSFVDHARHRTTWKGRRVVRPPTRWF